MFLLRLLLASVAALAPCAVSAQYLIAKTLPGSAPSAVGTTSACLEDLDGDGSTDLVTAHPDGYVQVRYNDAGTLRAPIAVQGLTNVAAALCVDLVNDGRPDIAAAGLATSVSVITNEHAGLSDALAFVATPSTSNARDLDAGDLNGDGYLDLVVARRHNELDVLLFNQGTGGFERAAAEVFEGEVMNSTAASLVDYDGDGRLDLLLLALEGNRLYRNEEGVLVRVATAPVEALGGAISPSWGDYDADGDLDLFVSGQQKNVLYRNEGDGRLVVARTFEAESAASSGTAWSDVDNDGDLDLIVTRNGATNLLYVNTEGQLDPEEFGTRAINVAPTVADIDNDGRVEVYVSRGGFDAATPDDLFTSTAPPERAWLNVDLRGLASNAQGIGAHVFATSFEDGWQRRMRPVTSKLGRRGHAGTLAHFGLGDAERVDLEVRWPSGQVQVLKDIDPNQRVDVEEALAPASVAATPTAATRLPADGGDLFYTLRGLNFTDAPQTYDLWAYAYRPDGTRFGPVVGPVAVTLEPGARLDEAMRAHVPAKAPPGTYLGTAYLGDFEAGTVVSESSLHFHKEDGPPTEAWVWTTEFVATGEVTEVPVSPATPIATDADATPDAFALRANYPNPFGAATRIEYDLPVRTDVRLEVFDLTGRLVRVLDEGARPAGTRTVRWEGRDASGRPVANGVYLYRLRAGSYVESRRLVLMR